MEVSQTCGTTKYGAWKQSLLRLSPLTGDTFRLRSTNTQPDARLDISARGIWNTMDKTFYDVRVFHDGNASNSGPIEKVFQKNEQEKKRLYNDTVIQVEKSTFTPLVFPTSGAMGKEATKLHKSQQTSFTHLTKRENTVI